MTVLVLKPVHNSPFRCLHRNVTVIWDADRSFHVCLSVPRSMEERGLFKWNNHSDQKHILVVIWGIYEYHTLYAYKDLKKGGLCRPLFLGAELRSDNDLNTKLLWKTYRPGHVPSRDKQTLPQLYKFGLNRTEPPPVVLRCIRGGEFGYSMGMKQSNSNKPPA